jgi:hypothetical protein
MIKNLWNTVILDGSNPQGEVERMIDNSFMLVVSKMTKKDQQSILSGQDHFPQNRHISFVKVVLFYVHFDTKSDIDGYQPNNFLIGLTQPHYLPDAIRQ